jgi:hypothetical protein
MNWYNIQRDVLPPPGAEVLICVRGVDYHGVYDHQEGVFKCSTEDGEYIFGNDHGPIYWTFRVNVNRS